MTLPLSRPRRDPGPAGSEEASAVAVHRARIAQSHQRCAALGVSRIAAPDFSRVGTADLRLALQRNHRLHGHAAPVMAMLQEQIRGSDSMVVLTDATGIVLQALGDADFLGRAGEVALQPGANWSEAAKGTNAIGTALLDEAPTRVHADEHYVHANQFLTCAAAPILGSRGSILGVLDVSGDCRGFHPHTLALVRLSARMIENHGLTDDFNHALRLHFHRRADFIGALVEGILAVDGDGRIVGVNRGAMEQLGLSGAALRRHTLQTLFDTSVPALIDRFRAAQTAPLTLHTADGMAFMGRVHVNGPLFMVAGTHLPAAAPATSAGTPAAALPAGADAPTHAATPLVAATVQADADPPAGGADLATLDDIEVAHIRRTLAAVHGNLSEAARRLGVSRNTIYRKLRHGAAPGAKPR